MDTEDLNEAEKARQVGKVMGKAGGKPKLPDKKIVIARGANKGVKGRPKGVKGRYKIVDARMRKEVSGTWQRLLGNRCRIRLVYRIYLLILDSCTPQNQKGGQEEKVDGYPLSFLILSPGPILGRVRYTLYHICFTSTIRVCHLMMHLLHTCHHALAPHVVGHPMHKRFILFMAKYHPIRDTRNSSQPFSDDTRMINFKALLPRINHPLIRDLHSHYTHTLLPKLLLPPHLLNLISRRPPPSPRG